MKRPLFALCAGVLLLGLLPASALATNPTPPSSAANLDQWNNPVVGNNASTSYPLGQTFTVGKTGMLSGVALNLYLESGAPTVPVDIYALDGSGLPTGPSLASAQANLSTVGYSWVHFSFPVPLSVIKNAQYAIVFSTVGDTSAQGSSDTYAGGRAVLKSGGWAFFSGPGVLADFAFMTFVDTAAATLQWDKPSITAGTNTQLTLTGTLTYIYGSEATGYSAVLDSLPSWYDPSTITITCSWAPGCTLAGLESGYKIGDTSGGATLTFTLVGTAKPLAADIPTPGTASGGGCLLYPPPPRQTVLVSPNQSDPGCADSTASVLVVAAPLPTPAPPTPTPTPSPTPPPTSTGAGSASDGIGGMIWFLPFALVASFVGLLVLVDRRRRRII